MATKGEPVSEPEKAAPPPEAPVLEPEKAVPPPETLAAEPEKEAPPPETKAAEHAPPPHDYLVVVDLVLRVVLFAAAVTSVVVMVTSKQTKMVTLPLPPFLTVPRPAKFTHSPAFM